MGLVVLDGAGRGTNGCRRVSRWTRCIYESIPQLRAGGAGSSRCRGETKTTDLSDNGDTRSTTGGRSGSSCAHHSHHRRSRSVGKCGRPKPGHDSGDAAGRSQKSPQCSGEGSQPVGAGRPLLCGAVDSDFLKIAEKLIDLGLDVKERISGRSYDGASAIYLAVWKGDKVLRNSAPARGDLGTGRAQRANSSPRRRRGRAPRDAPTPPAARHRPHSER